MANTNQETFAGHMGDIASAIRSKTGKDEPIAVRDMAGEIESILPASFVGKPLSSYSWPEIARIAEAIPENPSPWTYLVGQSKSLDLGKYGTVACLVVGVNHDTIAGTSRKAGLSIMVRKGLFSTQLGPTQPFRYATSPARPAVAEVLGQLDEAVRGHVKPVAKTCCYDASVGSQSKRWAYDSMSESVWLFSQKELGSNNGSNEAPGAYEYFGSSLTDAERIARRRLGFSYLTRTPDIGSRSVRIDSSGNIDSSNGDQSGQAVIGFCL